MTIIMSKLISDWQPSDSALDLVKLNGITNEQVTKAVEYLKSHADLNNIDDVDGYDNWDLFFIMFCIKTK